jgi:ankyrin repeat protein
MPRQLPRPHERLEIAEPCSVEWDSMTGSDRVRFCAHCRLHVHNLSEITPGQAMELVLRSGGRLCLRIERSPDGKPRTRSLSEPLYQIKRRASRLAAGAFGAALTLCSAAVVQAQTNGPDPAQVEAKDSTNAPPAGAVPDTHVVVNTIDELPLPIKETTLIRGGLVAIVAPSEPLVRAVIDNDLEAVKRLLLFEGAGVNVVDKNLGITALAQAVSSGNREIARELLWHGALVNTRLNYKQTALMHVRVKTNADVVRDLLDAGAKVNLRDEDGNTALIVAAEYGNREIVELLLNAGAKVDARNKQGTTALMNAAQAGDTESVRALINAGADVNVHDNDHYTALHFALDNDEAETAVLLLAYGAIDDSPPEPEETPNQH